MRVFMKLGLAGALALAAIAMSGTTSSSSAAMSNLVPGNDSAVDQKPLLEKVRHRRWRHGHRSHRWGHRHHRRHHHHRRHRHYRPRFYFGLGFFGPYGYRRYYNDDYYYRSSCGTYEEKKRCARKFRSFNWDTCRYTTYSGYQRLCPYVR